MIELFHNELKQKTINIPRAALAFARSLAYPTLNMNEYLDQIKDLSEASRTHVRIKDPIPEQIDALSDFLFFQLNFRGARGTGIGDPGDYSNPENSYLNRVLDTRMGIPISLSVIYIAVAKMLGMSAYGIGLPGHFIVGVFHQGTDYYVDPFNSGLRLTIPDCARLVRESSGSQMPFQPRWLSPVSPDNLIARMLTNLCNAYVQQEDWNNAINVIHHLMLVQPEIEFHFRDLGLLYMYKGSLRLAAQYLEEYLRRSPDATDYENVRSSLRIVAGRLALWN